MKDLKTVLPFKANTEHICNAEEKRERRNRIVADNVKTLNEREGNRNETDGYNCDICKNKGYLFYARERADGYLEEVQTFCKCQKIRRSIMRMKQSGLEPIVKKYTFAKYIATEEWQKTMLNTAREYAQNPEGRWLFLGGNCGCGKSHLCTAAAIYLLKKGNSVRYMQWREEAVTLKALVNTEEYAEKIKEYKDCDILYIDDLFKTGRIDGMQKPTAADINLAFEILNFRIVNQKITIISTEHTFDELIDIDEGIAGRIAEKCGNALLSIGRDKRKDYRLRNITTL